MTFDPKMMAQMVGGAGFIAALDQSGGSTPKALMAYGIGEDAWSNEEEMFALIHEMRTRIVTAPSFSGAKVLGAILFEKTMDGEADGKPVPQLLWERGVVPFLKVDQGLEEEADGVQKMKPMTRLDELIAKAKARGVFGTKMRSVINDANDAGIHAIVTQQFMAANQILEGGLMPIVEPEVNIKSPTRGEAEKLLLKHLTAALDGMDPGQRVMLKLTLPEEDDLYAPLVAHPAVARVVALSGGYEREEANAKLAKNRGMIASFSRALLQDLRADMDDAQFDAALGSAIDSIYAASVCNG
ncbi:fructose bisphosphate aldolase [Sphingomicrobium astaxanthinifaciens]|uniref:fructose bisphosphate aldolase n=1 Tax=Sphingomicrobium astaxanthinifaciens TaxID=1227949 RepID=UPI001FCA65AF|nr:fructose bisphosphate aldolase [Sphingomicrobium astaxanthinifaciens]MCJ7422140.1 fructose bisphosphate aldolase [Sphingomicrobium astaxanthinifaciens]